MKLTPEHDQPVYTQRPPTPIHLRQQIQVEFALLQNFGIITSLNHSKYSSPIFAHCRPTGELRNLKELSRISHLLLHENHYNNLTISTVADTTADFAGKSTFCNLDCSQAYHCVQMVDPHSVPLIAFNFASRTMAHQRLARDLNRSVTTISAFVRNYLETCLSANVCTQFMDDIVCGVESLEQHLPNLRVIFKFLRKSGIKLSTEKCVFGSEKVSFFGNVITKEGLQPENEKLHTESERTSDSFHKLLPQNVFFEITDETRIAFHILREKFETKTTRTTRLAEPGLQYAILCDASYHSSEFVIMIEAYVKNNQGETVNSYAPVSIGSKVFNTAQLKMSPYCKEFLFLYFALETFSHLFWGSEKAVLILTDNKSLIRFFGAKTIRPSLWNYVDVVTAFIIVVTHIPGKANAAANFLSRLQSNPNEILELKLTDGIPIREIEIDVRAKLPDNTIKELFAEDLREDLLQVV